MNYFTKERINRICDDLKRLININETPITHWSIKKGGFINPGDADLDKTKWEEFSCADDVLQAQDSHYWLKTIVTIPKNFDKKTIWLKIGTQIDFWDAVNPQFLLFINGEPAQGFDTNHRTCIVCENAVASQQITLELQAYTGTNSDQTSCDTSRLNLYSSIFEQDEEINSLYYDLAVPLNVLNQLDAGSLDYINIVKILNKAINILDLREPYSPEFYTSVNDCRLFLQKEMYENTQTKNEVTASCVGHTHIDIAWWWTVAQTRQKVCRSFATVLKLMEQYPDYKFMSSQPQLYKFVKERHPKMFEEIKKRVSEGRWEVEGGMWVEADCNVTSGESLIRQFLHGKKFFKDEFHKDNVILWLPDVFGYSAALPQIMKKCGIKYFMTTKIAWNQFNKFPFDTFWWRGIDSTEIFTHLITTQDENQSPESFATTYNGKLTPVCVMKAWERYQQKEINKNVLISYGYGDGGGGPTREMLECAKRMDGAIPGTPRVKLTTAREYFDKIYSDLQENKDVPRWVGELYLEYHRGTYTSMARNKKSNRQCEFLWQDAEFFCVLAWLFGKKYPHEKIYDSWETILLNQFHDILPGSSIKEVYEVTKIEYEQLYKSGQKLIGDTVAFLAKNIKGEKGDIVVFNTLSFEKDEIVEVDELLCCSLKGEGDSAICVQKSYDGKSLFVAKNLPPKGYSVFRGAAEVIPEPACVSVFQNTITTKFYIITLDENMRFTSIYDRENDREVLKDGSLGNVLRVYEDKPIYYDNWDIDIFYKQKSWEVDNVSEYKWLEIGPVRSTLFVKRTFLSSTIEQKIHFYSHTKRIDFETVVDWKQFNLLLKVEFAVDVNAAQATYDIQFGNIKRPTHQNTSWDVARFEVCAHKWADLSEGNFGVSLLNDCKYGYSIENSSLSLSLIKSGTVPNPTTDQEVHSFTYSLFPHTGNFSQGKVDKESYSLNVKPYATICKGGSTDLIKESSFFRTDCDNIIIETIKQSEDEDAIIVRMYECYNMTSKANFFFPQAITRVFECDMMENNLKECVLSTLSTEFTIKPFEIKTFKLYN